MIILHRLFILILLMTGLALCWIGAQLALLGGSAYYILAGAALIATAALAFRKSRRSIVVYGLFYLATLIWALWEAGLDGWALAPRLIMVTLFGLWILTPWFRSQVGAPRTFVGSRLLWPAAALLLVVSIGSIFWLHRLPARDEGAIVQAAPSDPLQGEWPSIGNDNGSMRHSPLTQITPANVGALKPVWTFHTGFPPRAGYPNAFQAAPLKIGERIYFCTGWNDVLALDAETGRQAWRHNSEVDLDGVLNLACRGVTYYKVPGADGACRERIYTATLDARLIALDAVDGRRCPGFGRNGEVDLRIGMGNFDKGYYYVTSPPMLARGKLVVGGWVFDNQYIGEPSGVIRAFDAVTGEFAWAFDAEKPHEHGLPPPGKKLTPGTPNSWAPMSADEELGLIYAPTGNPTPDFFGGYRTPAMERLGSAILAIDAETGELRWSFQTVHHDVWDYDVASAPTLIDLPGGVKGLLQPTKRGEVFFLDRRTGLPLAPVTERAAPRGGVPEERLARTQPFSAAWLSFAGEPPNERRMWGLTPIDQAMCRLMFKRAHFDGTLTPLNTDKPSVVWPGYLGGVDWGGVSYDPIRHVIIVNTNEMPNYHRLITRKDANAQGVAPFSAKKPASNKVAQIGTPYAAILGPFLSPLFVPCTQPPYGMIRGVDVRAGKVVWEKRFGTSYDSGPFNSRSHLPISMGVPNIGGSVTTASGLTFIGSSQDHYLRAYETMTGKEVWRARLPAGAQANPVSYWSTKSGRQFVVVGAAGRERMGAGESDVVIAFALPKPGA